jgi:inosose dehydratase
VKGITLGYALLPWERPAFFTDLAAIERGCADIRAAGFDGVEALVGSTLALDYGRRTMKNKEWPRMPRVWTDIEMFRRLGTLSRATRHNNLKLTNVFCDGEYINPETADAERDQAIAIAHYIAAAGGQHLLVTGGPRRTGADHDADLAALADALSTLARDVAEVGVQLCLHPHIDTAVETPIDIDKVFNRANDGLAVALDTAHVSAGGGDPVKLAEASGSRLRYVHLKDIEMPPDPERGDFHGLARFRAFRDFGSGNVDLTGFCRSLERLEYSGPVIAELDATETPAESAQTARRYLRETIGW